MTNDPLAGDDRTTSDVEESAPGPLTVWLRRGGKALLVAIVLAAAFGLLGPREGQVSAEAAGYRLDLTYPSITRAGQPIPLSVTVTAASGFDKTVQLRLCGDFFEDADFQNWYPSPSAETAQGRWIIYEFDAPPAGDALTISLDARTAPGQFGVIDDCEVSVLQDDTPAVSTSFTVWRMP